jgi:hypothetical protein
MQGVQVNFFLTIYLICLSQAFAMGTLYLFPRAPSTPDTVPDAGDMGGTVSVLNQLTPEENLESQQNREEEKPKDKQEKKFELEEKKTDQRTYPVEQRRIHE